ncbi:MAG: DsbE family thiol:disulfide interchange protein [Hyphomicrobiaceae bacterium]
MQDKSPDVGEGGLDRRAAVPPSVPAGRRRLRLVLVPLLIFTAMAGLFALALRKGDPSKIPSALIGRPAPVLELPPLAGVAAAADAPASVAASIGKGRPVVVNFWASWCVPCAEEHPQLVALAQRSGVRLVGINYKDQPASALRFLEQHGNPYAVTGTDTSGRAAIEWGVYGMPETFIVDGRGIVVFKHVGPITPASLERQVLPAIAKAGAAE